MKLHSLLGQVVGIERGPCKIHVLSLRWLNSAVIVNISVSEGQKNRNYLCEEKKKAKETGAKTVRANRKEERQILSKTGGLDGKETREGEKDLHHSSQGWYPVEAWTLPKQNTEHVHSSIPSWLSILHWEHSQYDALFVPFWHFSTFQVIVFTKWGQHSYT